MMLRNMALLLSDWSSSDWPAFAGILTVLVGLSSIVAALINGMIVKPMIQAAKNEISVKIEKVMTTMVSREVFEIFADNDRAEHDDMKQQLRELSNGRRH